MEKWSLSFLAFRSRCGFCFTPGWICEDEVTLFSCKTKATKASESQKKQNPFFHFSAVNLDFFGQDGQTLYLYFCLNSTRLHLLKLELDNILLCPKLHPILSLSLYFGMLWTLSRGVKAAPPFSFYDILQILIYAVATTLRSAQLQL